MAGRRPESHSGGKLGHEPNPELDKLSGTTVSGQTVETQLAASLPTLSLLTENVNGPGASGPSSKTR